MKETKVKGSLMDFLYTSSENAHSEYNNTFFYANNGSIQNNKNFTLCDFLGISQLPKNEIHHSKQYINTSKALLLSEIFSNTCILNAAGNVSIECLKQIFRTDDLILIDEFASNNLKLLSNILEESGIKVERISHNVPTVLEEKISSNRKLYRRIWFFADGISHKSGCTLFLKELSDILAAYDSFYLLINDSNGLSWTGDHGKGFVAQHFGDSEKVITIASLNKGFGGVGEVIFSANKTLMKELQVPQSESLTLSNLKSLEKSVQIHLSSKIKSLQTELQESISLFNNMLTNYKLPVTQINHSPIAFLATGNPETGVAINSLLQKRGFFAALIAYPDVPDHCSGIKINISLYHTKDTIKELAHALQESYTEVLKNKGNSREQIMEKYRC